jgi:MoaA/NifB/PqqE/SkfB family radical SAM enzyme
MINQTNIKGIKRVFSLQNPHRLRYLLNYLTAYFKTQYSSPPIEIQVEPSAVCNLKCRMCSLNKSTQPQKFLTPKNLSLIIKKFNPQAINLTGMGETLLNPYFDKLLEICHQQKIKTSFITNLQLLNSKHLETIQNYTPISISISLESGDKKTYEHIRLGANLTTSRKNLQILTRFINHNSLPTQVFLNLVFLDFNLKDISHIYKLIDLASQLKIKKITTQNINKLTPYIKNLYRTHKINQIFLSIKNYADTKNVDVVFPSTTLSQNRCYYPWVYPQITATGEILPCCVIPQFGNYDNIIKKYSFGNILSSSLNSTWNSKLAKKFRKNHHQLSPCKYCTKNQGVL